MIFSPSKYSFLVFATDNDVSSNEEAAASLVANSGWFFSNRSEGTVMSKQSKVLNFHMANEPSELCLQARTEFLEYIMRLKPQVVADLWEKAFPVFKLAVV